MAVSLVFINVLVQVAVIEAKYPGGLDAYRRDCPNRTFICDGRLTRVGFMNSVDTGRFVERLEARGLVPMEGTTWKDVAIVAQPAPFPTQACPWIATGRMRGVADFACLRDEVGDPGEIFFSATENRVVPVRDDYYFAPFANAVEELRILRTEGRIDICFDPVTGATLPVYGLSRYIEVLERRRRFEKEKESDA